MSSLVSQVFWARKSLVIVGWFALIGACAYAASDQRGQLSRALLENLEQRFERADIQDWGAVTGLVVLGGKATRVEEAVRLASAYPHLKLVLSGPGENEQALALTAKGVDPSRVRRHATITATTSVSAA